MPMMHIAPGLDMHYLLDDFTDPWRKPEAVLLLHGNAESSAVWFAWVPHLARHYRIVRPDMRGFGASTPMPADFPWSLDVIIDDNLKLMDALGIERFHLLGAKLGGTIARRFAARHPGRVISLTLAGTPPPKRENIDVIRPEVLAGFAEKGGVRRWAERTMTGRLGSHFPVEGVRWWVDLMGRTAGSTQVGFIANISPADISADIPNIKCPTLVITTEGSALGSIEQTRAWQEAIADSRLLVLPGDSYHVAASDGDRCAREMLMFLDATRADPRA